jgi:uncharacterized protein (DUF305 family)
LIDVTDAPEASRGLIGRSLTVIALVTSVITGCTGGSQEPSAKPSSYTVSVPVVQPGRPGETATTLAPGQSAPRPQAAEWNGADLYFVTMMVQHHTQALRMARLADGRAADDQVLAVARRITAAQAPEIQNLKGWLAARDQKLVTVDDEHAHGMPGAVTPTQIEGLARTKGAAFDQLFLDLMVKHHVGAVQMAEDVTIKGSDLAVQELAAEVSAGQSAEIRRMEQVRADL